MQKIKLETPRGTRDFPPEEKILRDKVINQIKEIFEIYGYSPLETPTFEKLEILKAKFGAGENSEAVSEIYRFKDQGNRNLGLRYEFTFALARFIGQNSQIKLPFKRYQIGPVFRDGPIKQGRYREFYQCDIDVVGASFGVVDAEILSVVKDVFKKLNLDIIIEINNRKLLNEIIAFCGIPENQITDVIIAIDKLKKIGVSGVKKELQERKLSEKYITKLLEILTKIEKGNNEEKLKQLEKLLAETEGTKELKQLFKNLKIFNVKTEFNPTLARGLGYYTGSVFEVFLTNEKIMSGSLAGGGRWDQMIGKYIGNENQNFPATGIAFGIEPILINSKLLSAQNRERYYWTNIPGVEHPIDKQIYLKDIIEDGFVDRDKAYCIDASYFKGGNLNMYFLKGKRQLVFVDRDKSRAIIASIGRTTLREYFKKNQGQMVFKLFEENQIQWRKCTPLECERLQTLPDNYTEGISNTQRYKCIGNGWTVDVISHILSFIK